jgi:hypothetical protein
MLFMVFALLGFVGMVSLVVDGGSWLRTQRQVQTAADAAALAGAQDMPFQATAQATANQYAQLNFSGIAAPTVTFPTAGAIDVVAAKPVSGIFIGALNATARAHARAQVSVPSMLKDVAPIAVKTTSACIITTPACFNVTTTVSFTESQLTTSAIGLIDLRCQSSTASVNCGMGPGASVLKDWIDFGYPNALPVNKWYSVKTGQNTGPISQGLNAAANARRVLLFPVFDSADASVPSFHVVAWAAFLIDVGGVTWTPSLKSITGHFTTLVVTDLAAGDPLTSSNDYGVHVINLTQ